MLLTSSLGEFPSYWDWLWYPELSPVLVSIAFFPSPSLFRCFSINSSSPAIGFIFSKCERFSPRLNDLEEICQGYCLKMIRWWKHSASGELWNGLCGTKRKVSELCVCGLRRIPPTWISDWPEQGPQCAYYHHLSIVITNLYSTT